MAQMGQSLPGARQRAGPEVRIGAINGSRISWSPDFIDGLAIRALIAWAPDRPRGGNRLSIILTALTQHLLGRSPSPLPPAHRDRRPGDRPDGDRYRTGRCHEHASGSA